MNLTKWTWAFGLLVLTTAALTAQKQTQAPPRPAPSMAPLFQTTTDAVSVDVVVRAASGQFLPDSKLDEFVVLEDGVPQKIQILSMSNGGRYLNLLAPQMAPQTDGMILPASRPLADTSGRVFVFFIDDANIQFLDTLRLRDVLHRIVKTLFHQGDLVAMVSSGVSSIEVDPTYDLHRVDSEVDKVAGSGMTPQDIIQGAQTPDGPAGLRYQANLAFRTALDMLGQTGAISGKRKSFIWVSSGYDFNPFQASRDQQAQQMMGQSTDPGNPNSTTSSSSSSTSGNPFQSQGATFSQSDLVLELSLLAQAANRANTTFYALDPRGLMTDMASLADNFSSATEWRDYLRNTQDSLLELADLTGGFAVTNTNDFDVALKRIDGETSDYYILGYTSNNPDPLKRVRKIDVQVKRAGAVVTSWRRSYTLNSPSLIKR